MPMNLASLPDSLGCSENAYCGDPTEPQSSAVSRVSEGETAASSPRLESSQCDPVNTRDISVEVVDAPQFTSLTAPWRTLAERAANPNVFMEPAVVAATSGTFRSKIRVLLAWLVGDIPRSR